MQSKIQKHNEIPVVLHNWLNYDYHLIIKKLAEEFEGQFECCGENTKKYRIRIINRYWYCYKWYKKGIRGGICQAINRYANANNKYTKDYNQNKLSPYLMYWDANSFICLMRAFKETWWK